MMRFRVFAWLAALVVLAGCVESSVEESISRAADGLVVEQSCESWDYSDYKDLEPRQFAFHDDSLTGLPILVSYDQQTILIPYKNSNADKYCAYLVTSGTRLAGQDLLTDSLIISPTDGELTSFEAEVFKGEVNNCEQLSDASRQRLFHDEVNVFDPALDAVRMNVGFVGCSSVVRNRSRGLIAKFGESEYRISIIMDQLITTRR